MMKKVIYSMLYLWTFVGIILYVSDRPGDENSLVAMETENNIPKKSSPARRQVAFAVINNSGISAPIYMAMIGHLVADRNNFYYAMGDGSVHLCDPGRSLGDFFFPLEEFSGLADMPQLVAARIYFSVANPLQSIPLTSSSGIPYPASNNNKDDNYHTIYDKVEYTYDDHMLFVNTTLVDDFSIPMAVTITGNQKGTQNLGRLLVSRDQLFAAFRALGSPFAEQIVTSDTNVTSSDIRMLSPNAATTTVPGYGPIFPTDYYSAYIDLCWDLYSQEGNVVTVKFPPYDDGAKAATGRVANGIFLFSDNIGGVYEIAKPTTADVLGCNGPFIPVSTGSLLFQQRDGIVKRSVAAAMNRGVFQNAGSDFCDASQFYLHPPCNEYARVIHESSEKGLNYAFPYDDVCDYSSGMGDTEPTSVTIELQPWK